MYGLFVGVDDYASDLEPLEFAARDATEMHEVLTGTNGLLDRSRSPLLVHRDAVGPEVTTSLIRQLQDARSHDTVILYFAGHALRENGEVYLAFSGAAARDIRYNRDNCPDAIAFGLIRRHIERSRAQNVVAILDCCFTGEVVGGAAGSHRALQTFSALPDEGLSLGNDNDSQRVRALLAAAGRHDLARELAVDQHGEFTNVLLRGLRGEARGPDGSVTLATLNAFVETQNLDPVPRFDVSASSQPLRLTEVTGPIGLVDHAAPRRVADPRAFQPLTHHLDRYRDLIDDLVSTANGRHSGRAHSETAGHWANRLALRTICKLSGATGAMVRVYGADTAPPPLISVDERGSYSSGDEQAALLASFEDGARDRRVLATTVPAVLRRRGDRFDCAIALHRGEGESVVLYLSGLPENSIATHDAGCRIFASYYVAACDAGLDDRARLEGRLLDDLRRRVGHVSHALHDHRYELFRAELSTVDVQFQPIYDFRDFDRTRNPRLFGWEALARQRNAPGADAPHASAPGNVFATAELWGPRFVELVDAVLVSRAIETFDARLALAPAEIQYGNLSLSINCHPQSLLREEFVRQLESSLRDSRIVTRKQIVLEISDKAELPERGGMVRESERDRAAAFKRELIELRRVHGIEFAIDDFGVGRSSPVRVGELGPHHVKIDKDVLADGFGVLTLEHVLEVTSYDMLQPLAVVVQGFEDDSALSLRDILDTGVRLIQGDALGRPGPSLNALTDDDRERARELWSVGHRAPRRRRRAR